MTAQRILLIVGGVLVVGLILGLVFALRADGTSRVQSAAPVEKPVPRAAETAPSPRPAQPTAPAAPPAPTEPAPPEGQADDQGRIVRDHRGEGPKAPPSPIVAATLIAVRGALEADLRTCAAAVSPLAGESPHIYMHATLHVAGGKVSATDYSVTGADGLGKEYSDCVGRALQGLSVAAPATQPDGEDLVHLPIRLP
jgi:hypothetical protein